MIELRDRHCAGIDWGGFLSAGSVKLHARKIESLEAGTKCNIGAIQKRHVVAATNQRAVQAIGAKTRVSTDCSGA